jgi:hypothetical protein
MLHVILLTTPDTLDRGAMIVERDIAMLRNSGRESATCLLERMSCPELRSFGQKFCVWRVAALVITLALVASGCGGEDHGGPTTPPPAPRRPASTQPSHASPPAFFSADSPWNRPVPANAPLDPHSREYVAELARLARPRSEGGYGTGILTTQFGVPIYTVPANERTTEVKLDSGAPLLQKAWQAVPLPADARAAAGTDMNVAVWQPSSDTLWEFWKMHRQADGWHARWGGRMTDVSSSSGFYADRRDSAGDFVERSSWGTTAAKASLVAGVMRIDELRRGDIPHALHLALPVARRGVWSLPARQTDGRSNDPGAIPLGARFRLDPRLDIEALHLPRVVATIARAAQRYGMIVVNTSGGVALRAEDPRGPDPYPALFGYQPSYKLLALVPWNKLQLLPLHLRAPTKQ